MPRALDNDFLDDLEWRARLGTILEWHQRSRRKPKYFKFVDDQAKESSPKKRKRGKVRKKRVDLHSSKEELDKRKSEWAPEKKGPDPMKQLKSEEKTKHRRFIVDDSDSEDESANVSDLMALANDFELNHGEEITKKIAHGRERLESDRAAGKADTKRQALDAMALERKRLMQVSSDDTSHSNNTTNISINVNNSGATFMNAAPPVPQQFALQGMIPTQLMNQPFSAFPMLQSSMMQSFPRAAGLDLTSPFSAPWTTSHTNTRWPRDALLREFTATCRGAQN